MFLRRISLSTLITTVVLGGAAVAPASPPVRAQAAQQIAVQNFAFQPATLTVSAGTTVTWTNQDGVEHTTTSDQGSTVSWDSGALPQGQSYSVTFTQPGTYTYHCAIHPFMKGTIIVQGTGSGSPSPTAAPPATATPTLGLSPSPTATIPSPPPTPTPVSRTKSAHKTITIKRVGTTYRFKPAKVTVKVGTRVTWSNRSDAPHIVAGRGSWKFVSKLFKRKHSVSFTFKKAGTYRYYCAVHPYMKGMIVVKRK